MGPLCVRRRCSFHNHREVGHHLGNGSPKPKSVYDDRARTKSGILVSQDGTEVLHHVGSRQSADRRRLPVARPEPWV